MMYKTIVLELIEAHPILHEQLKATRTLTLTLDTLAGELKASHDSWTQRFCEVNPGSDRRQMASEALEMAVEDMRERLHYASPNDEAETRSLDAALASLLRPATPSA